MGKKSPFLVSPSHSFLPWVKGVLVYMKTPNTGFPHHRRVARVVWAVYSAFTMRGSTNFIQPCGVAVCMELPCLSRTYFLALWWMPISLRDDKQVRLHCTSVHSSLTWISIFPSFHFFISFHFFKLFFHLQRQAVIVITLMPFPYFMVALNSI